LAADRPQHPYQHLYQAALDQAPDEQINVGCIRHVRSDPTQGGEVLAIPLAGTGRRGRQPRARCRLARSVV
jgi:hypothetical protein